MNYAIKLSGSDATIKTESLQLARIVAGGLTMHYANEYGDVREVEVFETESDLMVESFKAVPQAGDRWTLQATNYEAPVEEEEDDELTADDIADLQYEWSRDD